MHEFSVWAPKAKKMAVKIGEGIFPMEGPSDRGRWRVDVENAGPGTDYAFLLDDDPTLLSAEHRIDALVAIVFNSSNVGVASKS